MSGTHGVCSPPSPPPKPHSCPHPLTSLKGPAAPRSQATCIQQAPTVCQEPGCVQRTTENRMDVAPNRHSPAPPTLAPGQATSAKGHQAPQGGGCITATLGPCPGTALAPDSTPRLLPYACPRGVQGRHRARGPARSLTGPWEPAGAASVLVPRGQGAGPALVCPPAEQRRQGVAAACSQERGQAQEGSQDPRANTSGLLPASGRPGDMRGHPRPELLCTRPSGTKGLMRWPWKSQQDAPPRPALERPSQWSGEGLSCRRRGSTGSREPTGHADTTSCAALGRGACARVPLWPLSCDPGETAPRASPTRPCSTGASLYGDDSWTQT